VADLQAEQKSANDKLGQLRQQLSAKDGVEAQLKIRGRQLAAAYKTTTEQIVKNTTSMKELYDKRVSKLEDELRSAADDVIALKQEKDQIVNGEHSILLSPPASMTPRPSRARSPRLASEA
jgi:chromatin segregation and condensation protein Rec8/ScpA/Scc1 (kleisin family)